MGCMVELTIPETPTVAVLGGTGPQGMGLGYRLAASGVPVLIGSRSPDRAAEAAQEIGFGATGDANPVVAEQADMAIIAIPWAGHEALVSSLAAELAGKVVIDCVNPLGFDKRGAFALDVPEGSAAEQAQAHLPDSVVVVAFHNVSAVLLNDRSLAEIPEDVLVLGEVREATDAVVALASRVPGMRGLYGGRLRNCAQIEALTANLISINRRYKTHAGLRITGI